MPGRTGTHHWYQQCCFFATRTGYSKLDIPADKLCSTANKLCWLLVTQRSLGTEDEKQEGEEDRTRLEHEGGDYFLGLCS